MFKKQLGAGYPTQIWMKNLINHSIDDFQPYHNKLKLAFCDLTIPIRNKYSFIIVPLWLSQSENKGSDVLFQLY